MIDFRLNSACVSAYEDHIVCMAYEDIISVLGRCSGLSRTAKLLQVIAQWVRRTGRLLLVPFQTWEMGCDEIG